MKAIRYRLRRARPAFAGIAAIIGALAVVLGLGAAPALAAGGPLVAQFCQTSNGGYCLNDWNGSNQAVKMYQGGVGNETFVAQPVDGRCGGKVTSTCPFANTTFDARYAGFPIVQLVYLPNGKCVATDSSANPVLGTCNNTSSGNGGSNGTIFVDHGGYLINLYWSNQDQHGADASCMSGAASNGGTITLNLDTASGCPTWDFGLYEATNYDWATWVLHDGGWPVSANNVKVLTEWTTSEEPPTDWFHDNNPLNNGYGCGGVLGTCPNLFAAAQYVVDTLNNGLYPGVVSDLRASDSPSTTAQAICASPWDASHYGNCSRFFMGTAQTVAAPASDW
ncbi:MAG TPA: hypothetical protein VGZ32_23705 [Actinocrinis sp.]|jgi:hypothetical protein|uniref:hypothetical protein n=1 Tax=Actinocrinis sp. TaxID=1920516 RepID=UPI002DDDAE81|nr:hypothetical protein [Actinocrinis sp.]HEV3173374.1 hypothetical protein [Actinocrinis sp.]